MKNQNMKRIMIPSALFCLTAGLCAEDYHAVFTEGQWEPSHFLNVKSPRWDYRGIMLQGDGHIYNRTPEVSDEELFRKYGSDVFASLMLNRKFTGNATIRSKMSFDHRMAPLIVIAPELGKGKDGQHEFREHFEIVLFDEGINIWRHMYKDGKASWYKAAWLNAKFEPKKVYELEVQLRYTKFGCTMTVRCDGKECGYSEANLPRTWYAGITACEGRNRFYDFQVMQPKPKARK